MVAQRGVRDDAVRSVDRAVSILQTLGERGELGVSQIAETIGVHKSTVFRLLATLEARGLVTQSAERGGYGLGNGILQLAAGLAQRTDLSLLSRPITRALADAVGETVNIATCDGVHVMSIDQTIGPAAITTMEWVGRPVPLHATAAGKVFLAFPDRAGRPALPDHLPALTAATLTNPRRLAEEVAQVRAAGFAVARQEQEHGLVAVGSPIRELGGEVVAAVVVSGPAFRMTETFIQEVARQTMAAAAEISYRNGLPKPLGVA